MPIASNTPTMAAARVSFSRPAKRNIAAGAICVSETATRATRQRGIAGVLLAVMAVEKRVVMIRLLPFNGYDQILRYDQIPKTSAQDGTFACVGHMDGTIGGNSTDAIRLRMYTVCASDTDATTRWPPQARRKDQAMAQRANRIAAENGHDYCAFRDMLSRVGHKWSLVVIFILTVRPAFRERVSER